MAKDVVIALGDGKHMIPRLRLGQFEEMMVALPAFTAANAAYKRSVEDKADELAQGAAAKAAQGAAIDLLAVLASEADPPIGDMRKVAATLQEVHAAITAVLTANDMSKEPEKGAKSAGEGKAARRAAA